MSETTSPALPKIFSDILNDMAFIFVSGPEDEAPPGRYTLQARISYSGPKKGELRLRCDGRFAAALAANLLGLDPDDAAARHVRLDALKELMNVVCGNLMTELYGTSDLFELSIPVVGPVLPDEPNEPVEGAAIHRFIAEDARIELIHTVE